MNHLFDLGHIEWGTTIGIYLFVLGHIVWGPTTGILFQGGAVEILKISEVGTKEFGSQLQRSK